MHSEAFPIYHSLKEDNVYRFTDKIDPVKIWQSFEFDQQK